MHTRHAQADRTLRMETGLEGPSPTTTLLKPEVDRVGLGDLLHGMAGAGITCTHLLSLSPLSPSLKRRITHVWQEKQPCVTCELPSLEGDKRTLGSLSLACMHVEFCMPLPAAFCRNMPETGWRLRRQLTTYSLWGKHETGTSSLPLKRLSTLPATTTLP